MRVSFFSPMPKALLEPYLRSQGLSEDLQSVLMTIGRIGKYVSYAVREGDLGLAGDKNASGEEQLALDVLSDQVFCDHLRTNPLVASIASEEQEESAVLHAAGKYSIAFDPLDGSSLLDANLSVGSIFGIWEGQDFLGKTGEEMCAAGYFLYGPRTLLVLATEEGIWQFTENSIGEFTLSRDDLRIAEEAKVFAPGNLRALQERKEYGRYLMQCAQTPLTLRYSGGMVPDIHMAFAKGNGIFSYPSYSKYPKGKLRLLFECAPFAYVIERAGGVALDEHGTRILEKEVQELHERTTIIIGSKKSVKECVEMLSEK